MVEGNQAKMSGHPSPSLGCFLANMTGSRVLTALCCTKECLTRVAVANFMRGENLKPLARNWQTFSMCNEIFYQ